MDETAAKPMTIVELDSERWVRGTNESALLTSDGKMCCMGFAAIAFGASTNDLYDQPIWGRCGNLALRERDGSHIFTEARFEQLYLINDEETSTDVQTDDQSRVDALNDELERLGENFRFALKK